MIKLDFTICSFYVNVIEFIIIIIIIIIIIMFWQYGFGAKAQIYF
jgi:hypothetical protein